MTAPELSTAQKWLLASRPKTLPAAVVPVAVGSALAWADGEFSWLVALAAMACSLLIQIGTNLANDYYDFIKGADREDRKGPQRVVQSGLIAPGTVRIAMISVFAVAFLLGLFLVWVGGLPILLIGIASIICAVLYTAGPFPLAYVGLGDIFVFIFFGVIAVTGTHYAHTGAWSIEALLASIPVGSLATAILVVNNYRDVDEDRVSGKRTLAVRFGRKANLWLYRVLLAAAYAVPLFHLLAPQHTFWVLLPLVSAPFAIKNLIIMQSKTDGPSLNNALAGTAQVLMIFGLLYSIGFLLQ